MKKIIILVLILALVFSIPAQAGGGKNQIQNPDFNESVVPDPAKHMRNL